MYEDDHLDSAHKQSNVATRESSRSLRTSLINKSQVKLFLDYCSLLEKQFSNVSQNIKRFLDVLLDQEILLET